MREIYRCLDCDEVISVLDAPGTEPEVNAERDPHRGHRLRRLLPLRGRSWSRDPYNAPIRTVWASVTDGDEELLLARHKDGPGRPCRYRLVRGSVQDLPPVLSLPEEDLLRQIVWARTGDHPAAEEVALFVSRLRQAVHRMDVSHLEEEFGDFHDPLLSHGRLPAGFLEEVLHRCRELLSPRTLSWFRDFIRDHGDSAVIFGVRLRRDFRVVEEQAAAAEDAGAAAHRSVA